MIMPRLSTSSMQILFDPRYARLTHSIKAGLMLSWMVQIATNNSQEWIYTPQSEWQKQLCLTRHEQVYARQILRQLGVLEEKWMGLPGRIHWRLNFAKLHELIPSESDASANL